MRTIKLGETEVRAQGSPLALFYYQREFATADGPADWYADYERAFARASEAPRDDEGKVEVGRFLAGIDSVFLLKTLWAMARNADGGVPPFEEWAASLDASMAPVAMWKLEVNSAINAELFRVRVEDEGAERA